MLAPRIHALVCVVLTLVSARAIGQDALVAALYRESGLEQQVQGIPGQIVLSFSQEFSGQGVQLGLTPEATELIAEEVKRSFSAETMGEAIRAELTRELAADDIEEVLEWLRSPLGRRFTKMEEEASTQEAYVAMMAFGRGLQSQPPDEQRLVRIDQLVRALNAVDATVSMAQSMQMAIVTAMVAATPNSTADDLAAAVRQIDQAGGQMAQFMQAQTLVAMLFTYRNATDQDLERYVEFAKTPAGTRYHAVTFRSFERAMIQASQRLGKGVMRALSGSAA